MNKDSLPNHFIKRFSSSLLVRSKYIALVKHDCHALKLSEVLGKVDHTTSFRHRCIVVFTIGGVFLISHDHDRGFFSAKEIWQEGPCPGREA